MNTAGTGAKRERSLAPTDRSALWLGGDRGYAQTPRARSLDQNLVSADYWRLRESAKNFVFSSGPRLTHDIEGDPNRQAVASLRGYAYQLYATALAWVGLQNGDHLYLEVAEDYAVLSRETLEAVQVRDTAASGAITLRSPGVAQTINSFVELTHRNPQRRLVIRYLTTASISVERATVDRPTGVAGLDYWRLAASGADIAPLREVFSRLDLSVPAVQFISERDDESLRADLLRQIHWDCGAADISSLRHELEAAAMELGQRYVGGYTSAEARTIAAEILDTVLSTIVSGEQRILTPSELQALLERTSHVSVPRRQLEAIIGGASGAAFGRAEPWHREDDTPIPPLLAPRLEAVVEICGRLRKEGMVFACGATGMGKTLLARLSARALGGAWMIAEFAGLDASQSVERLKALLGVLAVTSCDGLILDDLNETDFPTAATHLARLRLALTRRDRLCLITAYRPPSARLRSELAITPAAYQQVVDLSEGEVADLVTAAGGEASRWARAVFLATACGHPQLTQATIADLQWRRWPETELQRLCHLDSSGLDLADQRAAARRRLVDTAPEPARALLARLSLLIGSFRREVALELALIAPPIAAAGDHLDGLTGPWVDRVGPDRMRVSPLLSDAGSSALPRNDQIEVHRVAADLILGGETVDVQDASAGLAHALVARSPAPLQRIALAVTTADTETRRRLAGWLSTLIVLRADVPIFPEDAGISRLLRFAQVLLVAASDDFVGLPEKWRALLEEISTEPDTEERERFELMVLAKVLLEGRLAETPDWVSQLTRFDIILQKHPDMFPTGARRDMGDPLAFYFRNLAMRLPSVDSLVAAFAQIKALPQEARERILAVLRDKPEEIGQFINQPWVAERNKGEIDGRALAETYLSLARQSLGWGESELAVRCHVARSIMLDEYDDDEAGAIAALQLAEDEVGPNLAISRARAKIAYRRRRHGDALALLRDVMRGELRQDAVERMFLCREAAISATELGEEVEALEWFRQALAAAQELKSDSLQAMAIGLQADVALAEWRCGMRDRSLEGLWGGLCAARGIDPAASLKGTYLHKVLGHACLWLSGQVKRGRLSIDRQAVVVPPGLCSNPDPSEEIRTLPPPSLEGSHYILAIADIQCGGSLGFDQALSQILGDRHIFYL